MSGEKVDCYIRYLVPITEDELSSWMSCLVWRLPRPGVKKDAVDGFKSVRTATVSAMRDDWLLAEYLLTDEDSDSAVPFFSVMGLYGVTPRKTALLQNHYNGFGLSVQDAPVEYVRAFEEWWRRSRIETLMLDCENGGRAMCQLYDCPDKVSRGIVKEVATVLVDAELESPPCKFQEYLLGYSRSTTFNYTDIAAALCDLGSVLRMCLTDEKNVKRLNRFATRIRALFGETENPDWKFVAKVVEEFRSWKYSRLHYVLFLKWKRAAEQNGGKVDFKMITADVNTMRGEVGVQDALTQALVLFGSYVGFESFAVQYHVKKRIDWQCVLSKEERNNEL